MKDELARILESVRRNVAKLSARLSLAQAEALARRASPARDFAGALRARIAAAKPAVIAEAKRRSPSRGLLRDPYDPAAIAASYERAGAAAVSVLAEEEHFGGSPEHVAAARKAAALPVLWKDFVLDPWQVALARAKGADAVLLIVAALSSTELSELESTARGYGMAVLVEVHDAPELERALRLDTPLIGINNRDLRSFETRLETTLELAPLVPPGRIVVSESGISAPGEVERLREAGVSAFLVGEALMRAGDPGRELLRLFPDLSSDTVA